MPLRRPRNPKGVSPSYPKQKGRKPGYAPQYAPEQTQRYQSQALRYSKAVELGSAGPDFVEWNDAILSGDDVDLLRNKGNLPFPPSDRLRFLYATTRALIGYWTVTYGGGGMADLTTFTDDITTTGTDSCTAPIVSWNWENPQFDWAADGIKVCGPELPGDGFTGYTIPPGFPGTYNPVPTGETRLVTITGTHVQTSDAYAPPPAGTGVPLHFVMEPYTVSLTVLLTAADTITTPYVSASGNTGVAYSSEGFVTLHLNGLQVTGFPINGFRVLRGINEAYYDDQSFVWNVSITGDGPLRAPPPYVPPPDLPTLQPGTDLPFPPAASGKATAGGIFTSNTFTAATDTTVGATLDYTTVPDIGAISGAIAVRLFNVADDTLVSELAETPSNGGAGQLEATFELEADQAYYFVIVIPETCYCNQAMVTIGGAGFECDCPDYTRQQDALTSPYNSEQAPRNWTDSEAGCDQEQGCKHIVGTKLFLALPVEVPTDYPL